MNLARETPVDVYIIDNLLACTGHSEIYEAWDPQLGCMVIIKFVRDPELAETEIGVLADLSHPNIIKILRSFTYRDHTALVLEHIEGGVLLDIFDQLDETRRQKVLLEVTEALVHLHKTNFHGDLCFGNVVLDHKNNRAVLIDFGYAHGQCTGGFQAPEHDPESPLEVGRATDIFALGKMVQYLDPGARHIAAQCCREDPDERPDAQEVLAMLQQHFGIGGGALLGRKWAFPMVAALFLMSTVFFGFAWRAKPGSSTIGAGQFVLSRDSETGRYYHFEQNVRAQLEVAEEPELQIGVLREFLRSETSLKRRHFLVQHLAEISRQLPWVHLANGDEVVAVFDMAYPFAVFPGGTIRLGSWVRTPGNQGYVSRIQVNGVFIEMEDGSMDHWPIDHRILLTNIYLEKFNIYIPGQKLNMRQILTAIAETYDLELVDLGGTDGSLSGKITAETMNDFLEKVQDPLSINFANSQIQINSTENLRLFVPIVEKNFSDLSCLEFQNILAKFSGYDYRIDDQCELNSINYFVFESDWFRVLESNGFNYRLVWQSEDHPTLVLERRLK